jgi:hypothetical protein
VRDSDIVLTKDDVREIRRRMRRWRLAQYDSPTVLAHTYDLSRESIYRIERREVYGWVAATGGCELYGEIDDDLCQSAENTAAEPETNLCQKKHASG